MQVPYYTYAAFLSRHFEGKVQKLPLDVGATCPVRDGSVSHGGCAFCNGRSFVPDMCSEQYSVATQLQAGKQFFLRKHPHDNVAYLAYFQAGSNTYMPLSVMQRYISQALSVPGVRGIVLATRPDCLSTSWLDYLEHLSRQTFVMVELGIESVNDDVLRQIGRGHDVATSAQAVRQLHLRGIHVGVHFILGLPGESRESQLQQAFEASRWQVDSVKLHQLQILRGSRFARQYAEFPERFSLFSLPDYVSLVADFIERLHPAIAVERFVSQSPASLLIAPRWGVKPDEVVRLVCSTLAERRTHQGILCSL